MLTREGDRVTLQLLHAEKFRAQQLSVLVVAQAISSAGRKFELFDGYYSLLTLSFCA